MLRQTLRSYSPGGVGLELGPLSQGNRSSFIRKKPLAIEFSVLLCFARFHVSVFWGMLMSLTGEGNGNPLQYSYLENPMDRGAW